MFTPVRKQLHSFNRIPVARCIVRGALIGTLFAVQLIGYRNALVRSAYAETGADFQKIFVDASSAHYVATDGNDAGPGTADSPWATINHAADEAKAGDTVIVRGGNYVLPSQVRPRNSGRSDAWITFIGSAGEKAIFDAREIPRSSLVKRGLENGAFQIENDLFVRVINLTIINSHDAGFTVRDSSNIELINDATIGSFSSGIAVWDTDHHDTRTQHIRIIGNSITKATTWDLAPRDMPRRGEPPHEALSVGGAMDFEVAYNHIHDSDKEGIDIKETSKQGRVHHNLIDHLDRQGIYVDAWFGQVRDIEISSNIIHDCGMAGIVLSVENGQSVESVDIHNNLVFNNDGSGLYFSRWGVNNPRRNIRIHNNIFYHNGYGAPKGDQTYYWMTGGLYLYSTNLRDIAIKNNIFSDNRGFQIGYSELYLDEFGSWQAAVREKGLRISDNMIDGSNTVGSPIESGGDPADRVRIYAVNGERANLGKPLFKDPSDQDFTLRRSSPAPAAGVTEGVDMTGSASQLWWKQDFPPELFDFQLEDPLR